MRRGDQSKTITSDVIYLDLERKKRPDSLHDAVINGAVLRLRPKLMTVAVILAGLLLVFLTEGVGADVMRRIALPVVYLAWAEHGVDQCPPLPAFAFETTNTIEFSNCGQRTEREA